MVEENNMVMKICPTVEELSHDTCISVRCPINGCQRIVRHSSALRLHLIKVHKQCKDAKDEAMLHGKSYRENVPVQFHCPAAEQGCVYNLQGGRHFATKKHLREHFLRVHGEKKHLCRLCGFGYGLERDLKQHEKICGASHLCTDCPAEYNTRQSLVTHCKRKGHQVPDNSTCIMRPTRQEGFGVDNVGQIPTLMKNSSLQDMSSLRLPTHCIQGTSTGMGSLPGSMVSVQKSALGECLISTCKPKPGETFSCDLPLIRKAVASEPSVSAKETSSSSESQLNNHDETGQSDFPTLPVVSTYTTCSSQVFSSESKQTMSFAPKEHQMQVSTANPVHILPKAAAIVIPLEYYSVGGLGSQQIVVPKSVVYIADTGPNPSVTKKGLRPLVKKSTTLGISANGPKSPLYVDTSFGKQDIMIQTELISEEYQEFWSPNRKQASTGTQTAAGRQRRVVAQTQTTGDYILCKAMQSADIPVQKESRASQVSPRARVKRSYGSTQTTQTQTLGGSPKTPRKKSKRHKSCQENVVNTVDVSDFGTDMSGDPSFGSIAMGDLSPLPSSLQDISNNETQTRAVWEELNDTLAESTCTQTLESFLAGNPATQPELPSGGQNTQQTTTETQTTWESLLLDSLDPRSSFSLDTCMSSGQNPLYNQNLLNSSVNVNVSSGNLRTTKNQTCTQTSSCTYADFMGQTGGDSPSPASQVLLQPEAANLSLCQSRSSSTMFTHSRTTTVGGMRDFTAQISFPRNQDMEALGASVQTQTSTLDGDLPDLLTAASQTTDFDPEYMHMQTQTMDFCDELLSNMQTQTTDSDTFLADFSFSDIETQTPITMGLDHGLDSMSVETQTHLHAAAASGGGVESMDMETQTLFPTLDLGTPGLMDSHTQTTWEEFQSLMRSFDK